MTTTPKQYRKKPEHRQHAAPFQPGECIEVDAATVLPHLASTDSLAITVKTISWWYPFGDLWIIRGTAPGSPTPLTVILTGSPDQWEATIHDSEEDAYAEARRRGLAQANVHFATDQGSASQPLFG